MGLVTCQELEPLLRDTYEGREAAWGAATARHELVARAVARVAPAGRLEDTLADVYAALITKVDTHRGLTRPEPCDARDPMKWLVVVVSNLARDSLRHWRRQQRGEVSLHPVGEDGAEDVTRERVALAAVPREELIDAENAYVADLAAKAAQVARAREAKLPPAQKLAWLAHHAPEHVDEAIVAAAVEASRDGAGLLRSTADTLALLADWRSRYAADPGCNDACGELAWILRDDGDDLEAWLDGPAARAGRDLLRQWKKRAGEKLGAA